MRAGIPGVPTVAEWLAEVLPPGSKVGIDPVRRHIQAKELPLSRSFGFPLKSFSCGCTLSCNSELSLGHV